MKQNIYWLTALAAVGASVQYHWLHSIPSMGEHAFGVTATTATSCVLAMMLLGRTACVSRIGRCLVTTVVGTVIAAASFWILELLGNPAASMNTLKMHFESVAELSLLLAAGWFVGLTVSMSLWLQFPHPSIQRD